MNETDTKVFPAPSHWIDGKAVPASGDLIDVTDPATGKVIAQVPAGTAADVDTAVEAALAAFPAWSATSPEERATVLQRVADLMRERAEDIATTISAEMGAPISLARNAQAALPVLATEVSIAAAADFPWTEEIANSLIVREPIGVVGAITPWNFPLQQLVTKVVPALLAGNTVVLKPSEVAPLSARIFAEITTDAGLPDGVLNLVNGTGPVVGEAISGHPKIDMISFTGSTAAGKKITVAAAANVKRVALELGGKAAHIILPDADLEEAVVRGLSYAWINGGQACGAWSRMLVPAELHDRAVEILREAAANYTVGDPTDPATIIGPLASETQRQRVESYIEKGIADGATLIVGGPGRPDGLDTGAYVKPTIFANVDPYSVIAQEEIFGPVLMVIPYVDDDEAVEIANSTIYGLSAAIAGEPEHAMAIARRLRVGQVDVNHADLNFLAPFGGYKQSGNGRELGHEGLAEFLETKAIGR
ncbi:aldehyde dehydrogenase (NAD+) [Actinocorallia herbida]|uniref:Aldehyde dehydrogenase (NAD+) n=1 Tax=Actinocorallia herbida TaxID=58109 RepID=A0A3N1CZE4_9ACTN|nr:aldehyde dehydrogenase family protein [Actinocorallia herbida]ROO86639.1 aldehyde dehydrogenase (NAD+) [Actinocorallia herbida]